LGAGAESASTSHRPNPPSRNALDAIGTFRASGSGYFLEQATRPQTLGYALLGSPVALAARMHHDTDSYYKISCAFVDGQPTAVSALTTSSTTSRSTG
jgi:hypothetical protein